MSRVQHTAANTNTEFRIVINGADAGSVNTGNTKVWAFQNVAFHGFANVTPGTEAHVKVEYKAQRSKLMWPGSSNGPQERQLTVINF